MKTPKFLFRGDNQGMIDQFNTSNGKFIRSYNFGYTPIHSLVANYLYLFSSDQSGTVKKNIITHSNPYQLIEEYRFNNLHDSPIRAMALSGDFLFTASLDGDIKQTSITTNQIIKDYGDIYLD